jgi:arginase family enzyme
MLAKIRATARLVVILGGDDSLVYWCLRNSTTPALVHLDAHEDAVRTIGSHPKHNNFVAHLDHDEPDLKIFQYGVRGLVPASRREPPGSRLVCRTKDELLAALAESSIAEATVSIDVDVVSPRVIRSVVAPMPGGLLPEDVVDVICSMAQSGVSIKQLGLMEFAPDGMEGMLDAVAVLHMLMRCIHACAATF